MKSRKTLLIISMFTIIAGSLLSLTGYFIPLASYEENSVSIIPDIFVNIFDLFDAVQHNTYTAYIASEVHTGLTIISVVLFMTLLFIALSVLFTVLKFPVPVIIMQILNALLFGLTLSLYSFLDSILYYVINSSIEGPALYFMLSGAIIAIAGSIGMAYIKSCIKRDAVLSTSYNNYMNPAVLNNTPGAYYPYPQNYNAQGTGASYPYPQNYNAQGTGVSYPYPQNYNAQGTGASYPYPQNYNTQGTGASYPYPQNYNAQGTGASYPYPQNYNTQENTFPQLVLSNDLKNK